MVSRLAERTITAVDALSEHDFLRRETGTGTLNHEGTVVYEIAQEIDVVITASSDELGRLVVAAGHSGYVGSSPERGCDHSQFEHKQVFVIAIGFRQLNLDVVIVGFKLHLVVAVKCLEMARTGAFAAGILAQCQSRFSSHVESTSFGDQS